MDDPLTFILDLTPEQREQIRRASGKDVSSLTLRPDEWEPTYKESWDPNRPALRVGRTLVIKRSGEAVETAGEDRVIELAPGTTFGTGAHSATQLCLVLLEERLTPSDRVLDVGTGSGILALAAARLGASEVLALDVDPAAVAAARENVALNDLAGVVQVRDGSVEAAGSSPYDLVVANILPHVIRRLAPDLARLVRPSGLLLVSGVVAARVPDVAAALRAEGLHVEEERSQGNWRALVFRRDASQPSGCSRPATEE